MKNFLFVVMIFSGLVSFANGGWVSSGGESLIYARNPWFVKNTATVNYCLQMDESSFSASKSQVEQLIVEALAYWRNEFIQNSTSTTPKMGYASVATQNFVYQSQCQKDTPLIFKLGLKTLDMDEVTYLVDPKKFIGVTIRKNYSLETLQGDGIIYISADKGADAYTNSGQMVEQAWKSPALLRYALIHELGHFFGLPHVGSGIMSEVFMTVLLNKNMASEFANSSQLSFLNPQSNFEVCRTTNRFNPDFFMVAKNVDCLKFEVSKNSAMPQWTVYSREEGQTAYNEIGIVRTNSLEQSVYSLKTAVVIQLPAEQKVFGAMETLAGPFLIGAVFADASYMGSFQPKGSVRALPIHMSLSADKISFVGGVNNLQQTVMIYSPLSFMKAVLP
jgi:hypothetical protein